nr:hypothetical protein [Nitrosomonas nitrosa]
MASKKRHINNEAELLKAMRSTGYSFPTNDFEQKMSLKLQPSIDIGLLAKSIDPNEIWTAEEPKIYKKSVIKELKTEVSPLPFEEQWGIAAKGSANISKETMDKIKKKQEEDNDGRDSNS